MLAGNEDGAVRLVSRNGTDLLPSFPEIASALRAAPSIVFDGELCILDEDGKPPFDRLRRRFLTRRPMNVAYAARHEPACVMPFDVLALDGRDVRRLPLVRRKALLRQALKPVARLHAIEHTPERGDALYKIAEVHGLEGIVAKPAKSTYHRGYESGWLKIKTPAGRATDEARRKWNER